LKIQMLIQRLLLKGRHGTEELADVMAVSENMVYRLGMPDGPIEKAVRRVIALMNLQKDYGLLQEMAGKTGHFLVKVPRVARNRQEDSEMVMHYQETVNEAVKLMLDYVKERTPDKREALIASLDQVASESIGIEKRVEKDSQLELEF
jgi:L-alanine-DL-glutamate epimerase-like enolase superfamily enzyme